MFKNLTLTVNGETHQVQASDRTQLAEVLRDHLDLTGTHVGCEQGVCGACTVMVDGKPMRSCITFAQSINGAQIETIEGYVGDPVMDKIREAFSRHHALQCGFCTPGMLATSHDILNRFASPSEATIRHELSGNLCRCTGYQGIVQAVLDVAEQMRKEGIAPSGPAVLKTNITQKFAPFDPKFNTTTAQSQQKTQGSVRTEGNWTVVERSITLPHPRDKVWALFSDAEKVAPCVPGAGLSDLDGADFKGEVAIAFGPIKAKFGGSGTFEANDAEHSGHLLAQGADKGGQSNVKGELRYVLSPHDDVELTNVAVTFRFQIQGILAQFNRPELVTGFVDFLLEKFISNCNAVLSGGTASSSHKIGVFSLGWAMLKSFIKRRSR
ncbi:MAG: 2Fe-2S iron-sulfur cluster-binding protein [Octadecabacter sp.]|nr:2Fe-2S iron-sulfur cluster-binding protein [Octadecabacter sp.]